MARVGKTLLGNTISTCFNVEYSEEPLLITTLLECGQNGLIQKGCMKNVLKTSLQELFRETFLLRNVNFRPCDLSYIGKKKDLSIIKKRLNTIHSYRDINLDYIPSFVLNLSEQIKSIRFLIDADKNSRVIFVIRHVLSVAEEIKNKQWFNQQQLLCPTNKVFGRSWNEFFIPYFVKKNDEEFFISLSEYNKGVYYWNSFVEQALESDIFSKKYSDRVLVVKYEDFVSSPQIMFSKICERFNFTPGSLTEERLSEVHNISCLDSTEEICNSLISTTNFHLKKFNYDLIKF